MTNDQPISDQLEGTEALFAPKPVPGQLGEAFVVAFHRAWKGAGFYQQQNPIFIRLIHEMQRAIQTVSAESGMLRLRLVRDACFCNSAIVRVTADGYSHYRGLIQLLREHRIGEVTFQRAVVEQQLETFIEIVGRLPEGNPDNADLLNRQLTEQGIETILAVALKEVEEEAGMTDQQRARGVYFTTLGVTREILEGARTNALALRKARRLMLNAVDLLAKDESVLLGLTAIKRYDDYTYTHCVNVAIYSIVIGNRLGLPKKWLNTLGIAALFHDIGKTDVAKEILNKPGTLTADEWDVIRMHPLHGAQTILRLKGWDQLSSRMIAGSFEHHVKFDCSGYPTFSKNRRPMLFSRIIAIADCYDALARPRVYRRTAFVSEKILAIMLEESGKQFDPVLLRVFINTIGVYPLGSLVQLSNGSIGIVTRIPIDPEHIAHPIVTLIHPSPTGYHKGASLDLSEKDPTTSEYRIRILRTLDPNEYQVDMEEMSFMTTPE